MPRKNILTILTQEHREVDRLLATLTKKHAVAERKDLFALLEQELTAHAEFEEQQVYPHLLSDNEDHVLALEGEEEHLQMKRLLAEMSQLPADDPRWDAKLKVLTENVQHHVHEEQEEMFPQLREALSKEELFALADEYAQTKTDRESEPVPVG